MHNRFLFLLFLWALIAGCSSTPDSSKDELLGEKITALISSKDVAANIKEDSLNTLVGLIGQDSIRNKYLFKISYHYLKANDSLLFEKWNQKSREISFKLLDTSLVAESYWDLATFQSGRSLQDSAFRNYQKAHKYYKSVGNLDLSAAMLLNMAIIQKNIGDLSGSEKVTVEAIELLQDEDNELLLNRLYNNLGIVYSGMREYQKALEHHEKAFLYGSGTQDPELSAATTLNNKGTVLQKMGFYSESIKIFNEALSVDSLFEKRPKLYAMLLDNRSFSQMNIQDTVNVSQFFFQALEIREGINHLDGIVINKIHLSQFFALKGDTLTAKSYAMAANELAHETQNNRDILASYLLLSKIDKKNEDDYLKNYINLSDSIQQQERITRNKFAKIKFDTDQHIAQNQKLHGQRNVLIGLSLGIALLGFSGFVIKTQRTKNRELALKQEQQEANEKIFQLLLDQQNMKEEGRQKERKRLSEELHDGVLAKLFGLRLSLSSLNSQSDEASIDQREKHLEDLKELGKEIRQLSHELNSPFFTSGTGYLAILEEVLTQGDKELFEYKLEADDHIDWEKVPGNYKLHLLRILQEAVRNIREHSEATEVTVTFQKQERFLEMLINDNGKGFCTKTKNKGIGLKNMASRVKAMKGKFTVQSTKETGTLLHIKVPVDL